MKATSHLNLNRAATTVIIIAMVMAVVSYSAYSAFFSQPTSAKGLVGHWSLSQEDAKSSTITADLTPNGNNGTITGATYTTDRNEQSNKAMSFNGSSSYINYGDTIFDTNNTTFSISAWIKTADTQGGIVSKGDGGSGDMEFYFSVGRDGSSNGLLAFVTGNALGNCGCDNLVGGAVNDNVWHHVVATKNGASKTIYIDGVYSNSSSAASSLLANNINLYVGRYTLSSDYYLSGSIQDVRLYNKALSAAEIKELYGAYNPKLKLSTTQKGLVGRWSLGDEDEVMGADLMANYNFTSGWSTAGSASVVDADTFNNSTSDAGGIYKTIGTASGKRYRLMTSGSQPAGATIWYYAGTSDGSAGAYATSDDSFSMMTM
ncbi:hypothetical protein BK004_02895 [bacterium CG10_46_32]|nr:MAG: hypothetical protein BK004_02895 [bacterium CG10_46_32]PIR56048.1 MAG: hypothetical protein COU73_02925 [Parcubacteria group bacterium CG10_big_fil_rev_8_21_14_0_10_46_32]